MSVTGDTTVYAGYKKNVAFENCVPFRHVMHKLMTLLLMKQILLTLQCLCIFD